MYDIKLLQKAAAATILLIERLQDDNIISPADETIWDINKATVVAMMMMPAIGTTKQHIITCNVYKYSDLNLGYESSDSFIQSFNFNMHCNISNA